MTDRPPAGAPGATSAARRRLILALDVETLDAARALAAELREYFAIVKVGLELFSAAGPQAIDALRDDGFEVFADVKLHDIPTTVGRAAKAIAAHGPAFVTLHTAGGAAMLTAAREGLAEGATSHVPLALGVTVLTSDNEAPPSLLRDRAALAQACGLDGVVCAAPDLPVVREVARDLVRVVPGTRPAGAELNDQARVATPREAIALGADLLVIGRAVTAAVDRRGAARALVASLSA